MRNIYIERDEAMMSREIATKPEYLDPFKRRHLNYEHTRIGTEFGLEDGQFAFLWYYSFDLEDTLHRLDVLNLSERFNVPDLGLEGVTIQEIVEVLQ